MTIRTLDSPKDLAKFVKENSCVTSVVFSSEDYSCVEPIDSLNRDKVGDIFKGIVRDFGRPVKTGSSYTIEAVVLSDNVELVKGIWTVFKREMPRKELFEEKK